MTSRDVKCPTCGAKKGQSCMTRVGPRDDDYANLTTSHRARIAAARARAEKRERAGSYVHNTSCEPCALRMCANSLMDTRELYLGESGSHGLVRAVLWHEAKRFRALATREERKRGHR